METKFILGEIFSFIGAAFTLYSIFSKNKKNMIFMQTITTISCGVSNILLTAFSGLVSNVLMTTRHLLEVNGKLTKKITIIICTLIVGFGIYFNTNSWFGLFPITASVFFAVSSYYIKSVQNMRLIVIGTLLQWAIFDWHVRAYPMFTMDITISIITMIEYLRKRHEPCAIINQENK